MAGGRTTSDREADPSPPGYHLRSRPLTAPSRAMSRFTRNRPFRIGVESRLFELPPHTGYGRASGPADYPSWPRSQLSASAICPRMCDSLMDTTAIRVSKADVQKFRSSSSPHIGLSHPPPSTPHRNRTIHVRCQEPSELMSPETIATTSAQPSPTVSPTTVRLAASTNTKNGYPLTR